MLKRALFALLALVLAISLLPVQPAAAAEPPGRFYPETAHTISPRFVDLWDGHGGLRVFGYPITEEIEENGRLVQYFERNRFEYHPEAEPTYRVQLGLLSNELVGDPTSIARVPGFPAWQEGIYFPETGHSLSWGFLRFWRDNGGLTVFGYPTSEEITLPAEPGQAPVNIQWFERARFEHHPDFPKEYRVSLGHLGREHLSRPQTEPTQRIWIEAEKPTDSNFTWTVAAGGLSNSEILFLYSPVTPGPEGRFARYRIDATESAIYSLWSREFDLTWASATLWRIDSGPWRRADGYTAPAEIKWASDDHLYGWYRYGGLPLAAGPHTLEIKVTQPRNLGLSTETDGLYLKMLDAFLLAEESYVPSGEFAPAGTRPPVLPPSSTHIDVDASQVVGPWRHLERSIAHATVLPDPTILTDTAPRMRDLRVDLVRLDHIFDYYHVYQRDAAGNVTYNWKELDQLVDSVLAMGAKPLLSLSYMPVVISAEGTEKSPPRDYDAWRDLVFQTVRHLNSERGLGIEYWEVWNEPNLYSTWHSDIESYLRMYSVAAEAVRAADPNAKIGGPAVAGFEEGWISRLISYAGQNGLPLDFLSWHFYGAEPETAQRQVELAREWLSTFPQFATTELFVDEWSVFNGGPDDTSWNGLSDTEFAAAYVSSTLTAMTRGGADRAMFFALKDAPDPQGRAFSGHWGVLTNNGLPKPSYNALKAFSLLGSKEVRATSNRPDVGAVATRDGENVAILVWRLGGPLDTRPPEQVTLDLMNLPANARFERYLIDATHSNGLHNLERADLEMVESGAVPGQRWSVDLSLVDNSVTLILVKPS